MRFTKAASSSLVIVALAGLLQVLFQPFSSGQTAPAQPASSRSAEQSAPASQAGSVLHKTTFSTARSDPLPRTTGKRDRQIRDLPKVIRKTRQLKTPAGQPRKLASSKRLVDLAVEDGSVVLGGYGTRSMPLDDAACAEMAEEVVWSNSLPNEAVEILSNNDLMHQVRICATNGHVLITCYQNTATVSLRRPGLLDGCQG